MGEDLKDKKQQGKKTGLFVVGGLAVIIIILLVVVIVLLMRKSDETSVGSESSSSAATTSEEPKRSVVVTEDTAEEAVDEMLQGDYIAPGYYSVSMSTTWNFATGDSISEDAFVENLAENTNDVYFDVFLADNEDEAIYASPILPRGSELNGIALDKVLPAGTYDCIMVYHLVDENQTTISTLRIAFTINIEA